VVYVARPEDEDMLTASLNRVAILVDPV